MKLTELTEIQKQNSLKGGDYLGSIISWKINPKIAISYATFENLAALASVPKPLIPYQTKPNTAFKKAIAILQQRIKAEGLLLRYITKTDPIKVGIVAEGKDELNEKLDYNYLGFISLSNSKIAGKLQPGTELKENEFEELIAATEHEYLKFKQCTSSDLYELLKKFVAKYSIRLTPHGGSYFIPWEYNEVLDSVNSLVKDCDCEKASKIYTFDLFDSPQNKSDMGEIAQSSLEADITAIHGELQNFLQNEVQGKKFIKGIETRHENLRALRARVQMFSGVLNMQSSLLIEKLDEVEKALINSTTQPTFIENLEQAMSNDLKEVISAGF